ncbi:MAG: hypothetical protein ACI8QC_004495 [Planctomycetota bacterium]|jgi:hypothetical protein
MIATVPDDEALRKGAQGLGIRIGKAINRFFGRKGRVLRDRFHAKPLFTRAAIRHAIIYVLQNARKHGIHIPKGEWDLFSSGRFAGRCVLIPKHEWSVARACYLNNGAWTALRGMRPDVFPGHLQLRA